MSTTDPDPPDQDSERRSTVARFARQRAADYFRDTDLALNDVVVLGRGNDTLPIHPVIRTVVVAAIHGYLAMMWRDLARTGDLTGAIANARDNDSARTPQYAGDGPGDLGAPLTTFEQDVHLEAVARFYSELCESFDSDGWPVTSRPPKEVIR